MVGSRQEQLPVHATHFASNVWFLFRQISFQLLSELPGVGKMCKFKKWCTFSWILIVRDVYRVTSKRIRFESSLHRAFFLRVILNIWTKEKGYKYIKRWTQVPNWLPQRTVKCFYEFNQDPRGFFKRESNARNNHVCTGVWHLLGHSSLCWRGRFFFTQEEVHFYPIKEEADRQR